MSLSPSSHIEARIQQITQELQSIDDQLHALAVQGLNQVDPHTYAVQQRQMDALALKKRTLQDAWDRAMTDLAIYKSQTSPSHDRGALHLPTQSRQAERSSTPATVLVQATIEAWEQKNASALASYLSDDLVCQHILPQPIGKAQLIACMASITTAFPDWSFNGHVLNEENEAEQCSNVLYVALVTGTNTGYLSLPTLPIIPPTGRKVTLEARHLEFLVANGRIKQIDADFSPNMLEEVLAQLELVLP